MVYTQPRIRSRKWDAQSSRGFWDTNGSPNLGQMTRLSDRQQKKKKKKKKKKPCQIEDFVVPADPRVKLKESEKRDKYLDLAWELKKLWNIKVMAIPIVIGALSTAIKCLIQGLEDLEIRGRGETIQTTTLLRSARILRRVLESWGELMSLRLQWKIVR